MRVNILGAAAALALFCLGAQSARAASPSSFDLETIGDVYHVTADRTLYHSREKVKEAFGHVVLSSEGRRLACDYLWIDDTTKEMKARGNVIFVDKGSTIEAAEVHYNLNTSFGSIFYGRVYNDLYSLRGQLIRKVGDYHFLTTEGDYTTCKDCPESWKLAAHNVDLTVDGYAFMDGVFVTIKDVPTVYMPYLIVPVKTQRQTGLLFPRFAGASTHGFMFVQPLFLAIDKHQDATVSIGTYSANGMRYEGEHRYVSYNGIEGVTNVYVSNDRTYTAETRRGAIDTHHEWPFFENFGMRWRYTDVRDRDYLTTFEDLNPVYRNEPAIESNVVAQAPFHDFFLSAEGRRYRDLLRSDPVGFNAETVQDAPVIYGGLKERTILGPVLGSFYGRYDNFLRQRGPFIDVNGNGVYDPNVATATNFEYLREAQRVILSPEISMPFRVGPYFSFVPSAQYNEIGYHFDVPQPSTPLDPTSTRYFRYRLEANTTFEHIYDYNGEKVAKVKHQLTPFVNFSYIPSVHNDPTHRFQQQLLLTNGLFDQFDVVPRTNSTNFLRFPEGKSIYYGFTSRLIRKFRRLDEVPRAYPYDLIPVSPPRKYPAPQNRKQEIEINEQKVWDENHPDYALYDDVWDLDVSQAYDFIDAHAHPDDPKRAFSYLLTRSNFHIDDRLSHTLEYRYYPRLVYRPDNTTDVVLHNERTLTTSLLWTFERLQNLRHTRNFIRGVSLSYSDNSDPSPSRGISGDIIWSFNDFATAEVGPNYDLANKHPISWSASLRLVHPSECWGLTLHYDWLRSRPDGQQGEKGVQLLLNLTGQGLMDTKGMGNGASGSSPFGGTM